jgi:WD40 repeat protein
LLSNDKNKISSYSFKIIYISLILCVSGCAAAHREASIAIQSDQPLMTDECGDTAYDLAFSPDGSIIATSSSNATVCFWEIPSGRPVRVVRLEPEPSEGQAPSSDVMGMAFSPDGKFLAVGMEDATVRLIETAAGHEIRRFTGHRMGVRAVAFSPDGRTIASAGYDSSVRLWDVGDGRARRVIEGNEFRVETVSFSSDGRFLISGDSGGIVRIWDLEAGLIEQSFNTGSKGIVFVKFLRGENHILSVEMGHKIFLIGRKTGRRVLLFKGRGTVFSGGLSPDAQLLAIGGEGSVFIHNARTGKLIKKLTAGSLPVGAIAFSSDGRYFAATGYDGIIRLFDGDTGAMVRQFPTR